MAAHRTHPAQPASTDESRPEVVGGSYYVLDLTALGRQEEWEKPKGRADFERGRTPDFAE